MEIRLDNSQIKAIVQEYFKSYEKIEVDVFVATAKRVFGNFNYYREKVETTIKVRERNNNDDSGYEETLAGNRINDVVSSVFDKRGYDVSSVTIDNGLVNRLGPGMERYNASIPYFRGIVVQYKEKSHLRKEKTIKTVS